MHTTKIECRSPHWCEAMDKCDCKPVCSACGREVDTIICKCSGEPETLPEARHPENLYRLNRREYATVLAALRFWQELLANTNFLPAHHYESLHWIATDAGNFDEPLDTNEIDVLVERMQYSYEK